MHLGTRSWTDTTTNSVFYRGLDSSAYLRWLTKRDLSGAHLVGPFLHEFTHHWCQRSLLGVTLALMELRLSLFTEAYPDGRPTWARDLVAYRMITNLLRPLSEGLAQMAEYDLTHIDDEAHPSTPLGVAVLCFSSGTQDLFRHSMLQLFRHSDELLDRKASLYFKKFEVEDGYLPGYMAAKNAAWSIVGRGYNVPVEVFLAYMRSYFWDDPGLINILISEEMDGSNVAQSLYSRFIERFLALFTAKDLPDSIQAFWKKWTPDDPSKCAAELGCDPSDFDLALKRADMLEQHFHILVDKDPAAVEKVAGMPADQVHGLLQTISDSRRYVEVASAEVTVTADGPPPELVGYVTLPPGTYQVSAVIPTFGTFLGVLSLDSQGNVVPLMEVQAANSDDGIRKSTLRFIGNRQPLQATMERIRARFLETGLKVVASKVVDQITAWSMEQSLKFYAFAACVRIPDQQKAKAARDLITVQGLRPLFAKDALAARLVAGMSMLSSTDQWLQQDSDALVKFAKFYYLRDEEEADLIARRDALLARDQDALLLRRAEEFLLIYV